MTYRGYGNFNDHKAGVVKQGIALDGTRRGMSNE